MKASLRLLNKRRFAPLFVTQLLGAFNDNLFKNAMVLFVVYSVYNDPHAETWFSAIATGLFIIPFFLLSALSGQLADQRDKARRPQFGAPAAPPVGVAEGPLGGELAPTNLRQRSEVGVGEMGEREHDLG